MRTALLDRTRVLGVLGGHLEVAQADKGGNWKHPRSLEQIKKTLATILTGDANADERTQALRRLKAYRYLADVPYKDLVLDENYNNICLAGAKLCEKLGKLEHYPKNPGMPADEFKRVFEGTSRSNLGWGLPNLAAAVDAWMFDADAVNMAKLGHRRWCLNPTMAKTGFGQSGTVTAMYSFDRSRAKVADFDFICYPARGYMPSEFFDAKAAWSITLNPGKYQTPDKEFVPRIYPVDASGMKQETPLKLDFHAVDTTPFGIPNCIIFRPEELPANPGQAYIVELEGVRRQGGGPAVTLRYLVEFVKAS